MRSNHERNVSEDSGELLAMVRQTLAAALAGPSFLATPAVLQPSSGISMMAAPRVISCAESFMPLLASRSDEAGRRAAASK